MSETRRRPQVRFPVDPEELERAEAYAKKRGLTVGQLAKFCMFQYMNKNEGKAGKK